MQQGENIIDKKMENKVVDAKNNVKAAFYTLIIFAIVVAIWVYTNPFFNKPETIKNSLQVQPQTIEKVNTINQSFKTMWSDVVKGFSNLK